MRVELELRNMPRQRIMEYLAEAGAIATGERTARAASWTAELIELAPAKLGVMVIPRDVLVIEGEATAVRQVETFMRQKTMRGGG